MCYFHKEGTNPKMHSNWWQSWAWTLGLTSGAPSMPNDSLLREGADGDSRSRSAAAQGGAWASPLPSRDLCVPIHP